MNTKIKNTSWVWQYTLVILSYSGGWGKTFQACGLDHLAKPRLEVVEYFPSMCETLSSFSSIAIMNKNIYDTSEIKKKNKREI